MLSPNGIKQIVIKSGSTMQMRHLQTHLGQETNKSWFSVTHIYTDTHFPYEKLSIKRGAEGDVTFVFSRMN
jgi:hypothetical protein